MTETEIDAWRQATIIDKTLQMRSADWPRLGKITLHPRHYSLAKLQHQMAICEPVVFRDCPVTLKGRKHSDPDKALLRLLLSGFSKEERARVKLGPSASMKYLDVSQVVKRWTSGRSIMNVSDLHFRNTKFEKGIESSALTNGNILPLGNENVASQEMFTLVISTKGAMSDSHSDDPDGNNHCFIGKKLWLAWDTFEGKSKGLEDVSRFASGARASFSMSRFLALKSARWFTVGRNQTLFLPGKLPHKVITLENYIGIGCFYVTLPNCLGTLIRWNKYGPLWALNSEQNDSILDDVIRAATIKIRKLRLAPPQIQEKWGLSHLKRAAKQLAKEISASKKQSILSNQLFAELIEAIGS